jgi:hypothetical protein
MPKEVDVEAMKELKMLDLSKPPMRDIPHMEFPKCIYLHPKDKYRVIRRKDDRGNVVEEYKEPTTHKSKVVADKAELDKALKSGWKREPYLPVAVPDEEYPETQAS